MPLICSINEDIAPGDVVLEASTLRLEPGQWPSMLNIISNDGLHELYLIRLSDEAGIYSEPSTKRKFTILND